MGGMTVIREHEFADGKCRHCGLAYRADTSEFTCNPRAVETVRPTPPSIFAAPWEIGERLKEIRAEEDKALAGSIPETLDWVEFG